METDIEQEGSREADRKSYASSKRLLERGTITEDCGYLELDRQCEWYCSKVRSQNQKQQYELARELTLERGFDLELISEEGDPQYYLERGVLEGVARRFVRDVKAFLTYYDPQ